METLGSHPGLDTIIELLNRLGNPQNTLRCIHIAGTNGKGSTAAFLTSILIEANYKVGTFTSPEIITVRETICINKMFISPDDLDIYLKRIKVYCDEMVHDGHTHPTRFEVLTALAFLYFKETACSVVVLEAGMGGRLDATNVLLEPLCCIITSVSFDHMQFLGSTLEAIAYEKSGIIKEACPVVLYPAEDTVYQVFKKACKQNHAPLTQLNLDDLKPISSDLSGQVFSYKAYSNVQISLLGKHQMNNAALALETVEILRQQGLTLSLQAVYQGFSKAAWPGRFEKLKENPLFFIDGAHNEQGARALADTIQTYFKDRKVIFIMGLLKDKDYAAISQITAPLASDIFLVEPANSRALDPHTLCLEVQKYCPRTTVCDDVSSAAKQALGIASSNDVIVAFGSLYFIGQIPELL